MPNLVAIYRFFFWSFVLEPYHASESPGRLAIRHYLGAIPRVPESVCLGWKGRNCISNFPGDADAAALGTLEILVQMTSMFVFFTCKNKVALTFGVRKINQYQ
jgi:hypothetical protein